MKKTIFIIILILAVAALVYWQFGEKIIKNASAPSETPGESLSPSPSLNPDEYQPSSPKDSPAICQNLCGDGTCQRIVCMGSDCPCAETIISCPIDCEQ